MLWKSLLQHFCHTCPCAPGRGRHSTGAGGLHSHHPPPSPLPGSAAAPLLHMPVPLEEHTTPGGWRGMDQLAAPGSSLPACLLCPQGWQWDQELLWPLAQSWRSPIPCLLPSGSSARDGAACMHSGYPSVPSLHSPSSPCPAGGPGGHGSCFTALPCPRLGCLFLTRHLAGGAGGLTPRLCRDPGLPSAGVLAASEGLAGAGTLPRDQGRGLVLWAPSEGLQPGLRGLCGSGPPEEPVLTRPAFTLRGGFSTALPVPQDGGREPTAHREGRDGIEPVSCVPCPTSFSRGPCCDLCQQGQWQEADGSALPAGVGCSAAAAAWEGTGCPLALFLPHG